MAAEGGGEETTSLMSPTNKVKFLCSRGGKILPRPTDGHLKYVGGETRVVAVPRDLNFSDLMKTLTTLFDGDTVLKYQLIPEDLDALVTVKTDDDIHHMLNEYDRHKTEGTPRLRVFLFPSNPITVDSQMAPSIDPHLLEQQYIDAINGIIRTPTALKLAPSNTLRPSFSISSPCSSPKTLSPDKYTVSSTKTLYPEKYTVESMNQETMFFNGCQNSQVHMHKVKSSPSLCSLSDYHHHSNNQSNHHHLHHHHQSPHHNSYLSSRPPLDPHKSCRGERLVSALSAGFGDHGRGQMCHSSDHHYSTTRHHRGGCGGCNHYGHFNDCNGYGVRRLDRAESLPRSPQKTLWEQRHGNGIEL